MWEDGGTISFNAVVLWMYQNRNVLYQQSYIYIYIWINLISLFKLSLRAKVHFLFPYDVPSSLHHHNNFFMS